MIGEGIGKVEGDVLEGPLQRSGGSISCTKPGVAGEVPVDVGPCCVGGEEESDVQG